MNDLSRRRLLAGIGGTVGVGAVGYGVVKGPGHLAGHTEIGEYGAHQPERSEPEPYEDYEEIIVPDEFDTIQAAVDAAEPRTLIMVEPGIYRQSVDVLETEQLTIRGRDRNEVILDGEFERAIGVNVHADEVVVENMTARHYRDHGFYWGMVDGYRGSYLTAYNNKMYGVYVSGGRNGRFEHSYASGHTDAGFYNGHVLEGSPHNSVLTDCVSEYNGLGFSGTNIAGRFTIKDSIWRFNKGGIVPNTFDSREEPPQHKIRIQNNEVYANNSTESPSRDYAFNAFGTGIAIAGGRDNEIFDNHVYDHINFGIAIAPMYHGRLWLPSGNEVRDNVVENSGRADLALALPNAGGNEFSDNDFDTSRPSRLEADGPFSRFGDPWVTFVMLNSILQAETDSYPEGDWRNTPHPDRKINMPDVDGPPRRAVGDEEVGP